MFNELFAECGKCGTPVWGIVRYYDETDYEGRKHTFSEILYVICPKCDKCLFEAVNKLCESYEQMMKE